MSGNCFISFLNDSDSQSWAKKAAMSEENNNNKEEGVGMDVLFVSGVADDNRVQVVVDQNGRFQYLLNGSSSVSPWVDKSSRFKAHRFILAGSGGQQRYGFNFKPSVIFNEVSDADSHTQALSRCTSFCNQQSSQHNCAVINAPESVLQTRRDQVAEALSDIEGVKVPKTIRFHPESPADVRREILNNFSGPVLLRVAGLHGGQSLIKIDGTDKLEQQLYAFALDGRPYYLAEFSDFKSRDGYYRKCRLAVVEGTPYLRHLLIHDSWMVHRTARAFMARHGQLVNEEREWMTDFYKTHVPVISERVKVIAERLSLDYFGIDCHIDEEGRMLIFEANANMNILVNTQPSPNIWDAPIAAIREHIVSMILRRTAEVV